jgi:hypothetical protein
VQEPSGPPPPVSPVLEHDALAGLLFDDSGETVRWEPCASSG